jgi:pyridoxal phosphate enzyme (YggS family)
MVNETAWKELMKELDSKGVTLVAVSKTKPVEDIQTLYELGQRDFGENYVQELTEKQPLLPSDIRWHYIGHLQSNKVKQIASFVHLIHTVDSFKLLLETNKQAAKYDRVIDVLLQLHIAEEETKFGLDENKLLELLAYYETRQEQLQNVRICGLMGMATLTEDEALIRSEFSRLHNVFLNLKQSNFLGKDHFNTCSMGMSSDFNIAISEGANMVRIGSLLFGARG